MDTNENILYITTTECDVCHTRGPGLLYHCNGTPVLGVCKHCGPTNFEAVARQDIDAWLAGGDTLAFDR